MQRHCASVRRPKSSRSFWRWQKCGVGFFFSDEGNRFAIAYLPYLGCFLNSMIFFPSAKFLDGVSSSSFGASKSIRTKYTIGRLSFSLGGFFGERVGSIVPFDVTVSASGAPGDLDF